MGDFVLGKNIGRNLETARGSPFQNLRSVEADLFVDLMNGDGSLFDPVVDRFSGVPSRLASSWTLSCIALSLRCGQILPPKKWNSRTAGGESRGNSAISRVAVSGPKTTASFFYPILPPGSSLFYWSSQPPSGKPLPTQTHPFDSRSERSKGPKRFSRRSPPKRSLCASIYPDDPATIPERIENNLSMPDPNINRYGLTVFHVRRTHHTR
jgi:hypothetical protein